MTQVGEGVQEFTPPPEETSRLISTDYSVPSTLLIRFTDDDIDQTDDIAEVMRQKHPTSKRFGCCKLSGTVGYNGHASWWGPLPGGAGTRAVQLSCSCQLADVLSTAGGGTLAVSRLAATSHGQIC